MYVLYFMRIARSIHGVSFAALMHTVFAFFLIYYADKPQVGRWNGLGLSPAINRLWLVVMRWNDVESACGEMASNEPKLLAETLVLNYAVMHFTIANKYAVVHFTPAHNYAVTHFTLQSKNATYKAQLAISIQRSLVLVIISLPWWYLSVLIRFGKIQLAHPWLWFYASARDDIGYNVDKNRWLIESAFYDNGVQSHTLGLRRQSHSVGSHLFSHNMVYWIVFRRRSLALVVAKSSEQGFGILEGSL